MQNNYDLIEVNDLTKNANGGTELMLRRLHDGRVSRDILEQCQIIPTRVRELKEDKFRILWIHDLALDPETQHLANGGWRKFHKLVFVSNWQAHWFIRHYNIPWSKCVVIPNAVIPLESRNSDPEKVRLIYHTTPHRGLNILLPVFDALCKEHSNIQLDVYSSFKLYGWEERDEHFKDLFDFARNHSHVKYHGAVDNDTVRQALTQADIFAYPCTWEETSCLSLIEAMSAGLMCIHPNFGALFETAANWTNMYGYHEDTNEHAKTFCSILDHCIKICRDENIQSRLQTQRVYTNAFYSWEIRAKQWEAFLRSIIESNEPKEIPGEEFVYSF